MRLFNREKKLPVFQEHIPAPTIHIVPTVEPDYRRPCYVRGKKAIFHRWVNSAHPVLPRGEEPSDSSRYYQYRRTEALVEYENGTVARVYPSLVQFADNDFDRYEWRSIEELEDPVTGGEESR